eukprot:gb/GECH01013304.1/.p1 GENE.gb/GECH01013304.1/~~gb/GECH01013304.1/.p1  ORF type:complete len:349 (+),score=63.76 gb/GECH01013304.1/:1-1047(+)
MSSTPQENLEREWKDYIATQEQINNDGPKIKDMQCELYEKQSDMLKNIKQQRKVSRIISSLIRKCDTNPEIQKKKETLEENEEYNKDIERCLPNSGGWFVELFLGSVNNVVFAGRQNRKLNFKKEYESFKYRWTLLSVPLSLLLLVVDYRPLDTIFQLYLFYFYLTLALRENILLVNGSNIKAWWINHHYVSLILVVTMLTWPGSSIYAAFRPQFYIYATYAGVVQIMQYKYQMARLYTLKTLGKASVMDVANSDSAQVIVFRNFLILIPFVFVGHIGQLLHSFCLFRHWYSAGFTITEWQVPALALLWGTVGWGNFYATLLVLLHKVKQRPSAKTTQRSNNKAQKTD